MQERTMSVRTKILLTIIMGVLGLSVLVYVIGTQVILKSYLVLERESVEQNIRRVTDAFSEFENQQLIKLSDWAAWDEAYTYARDKDPQWAEDTVYATGLANLDINAMMFSDLAGAAILLMTVDIPARVEVPNADVQQFFSEHTDLITFSELTDSTKGFALLPKGPAIVVSLPLRTSEGLGPSTGSITFMRYLDADKISVFADITHLTIDTYLYSGQELPADVGDAKARLDGGESTVVTPLSPNSIAGYTFVTDVYGKPILLLRVETPRPIYTQGNTTLLLFMGMSVLALIVFGVVILLLLEQLVIARFFRLTGDVAKINDGRDLSMAVTEGEKDEIGRLGEKINQMLKWLREARESEANSRREVVGLLDELKKEKEQAEEMARILESRK